ncbi:hypothetical protein Q9966_001700 [Columba livia]|nr:hypothetical protein Q9966_001700 [Columba livia]
MLRHFPYAQQQFLKLGGLQVLRSLFRQKGMEPLHVRVVTLLYDLMVEKAFNFTLCFSNACLTRHGAVLITSLRLAGTDYKGRYSKAAVN